MSGQRMDFYGYMRGFKEDRLRIGNIVLDYKNPDSRRSCIRRTSDFESEMWTSTEDHSNCRFKISEHGGLGVFGAVEPFVSGNFGQSTKNDLEIRAEKMSRIEIKSEKLDDMVKEVIKSEPGRTWLHAHLTAAFTLTERVKRSFRPPTIWLLTGKYVADDARYKTVRNHIRSAQGKGGAPGDPAGMTLVQGGSERERRRDVEAESTMDGKSVWACKWLSLKCTIVRVDMTEAIAEHTDFDVEITDQYARGSVRSDEEVLFARLEVAGSLTVDKVGDENVDDEKVDDKKVDGDKVDDDKVDKDELDKDKVDDDKVDKDELDKDKADKGKPDKVKADKDKVDDDKAGKEKVVDDMSKEDWDFYDDIVKKATIEYA